MNEYGQDINPTKKKSIWNVLDAILQPAVQIYTDIRGVKTDGGGLPNGQPNGGGLPVPPPSPCDEGFIFKNGKCVKQTQRLSPIIIAGFVLAVGAGGYFLWKKYKK